MWRTIGKKLPQSATVNKNTDMLWRSYSLPKLTLTKEQSYFHKSTKCGPMKVRLFFFSQFCQTTPEHWIKATGHWRQWSMVVWQSWYGDVAHTMESVVLITYQVSWISLNTSKYLKRSCCLMLKRKCPFDWVFPLNNDSKHTSKQQHLGSWPTRLMLRSGQS